MDNEWQNLSAKKNFDLNKLFNPEFLKLLEENFEGRVVKLINLGVVLIEKEDNSNEGDNSKIKGDIIEIKNKSVEDTLMGKIILTSTDSECFDKVKEVLDEL